MTYASKPETSSSCRSRVRGFRCSGRIIRPAIYELKPGETLRDLIQYAGGFEADALRRRVQIDRIVPPAARTADGKDRMVIDLAADQFTGGTVPAFQMMAGDSVTVFEVAMRRRDFVTVTGDVWVEGRIGFSSGMTLSNALRLAGGPEARLLPGPDPGVPPDEGLDQDPVAHGVP